MQMQSITSCLITHLLSLKSNRRFFRQLYAIFHSNCEELNGFFRFHLLLSAPCTGSLRPNYVQEGLLRHTWGVASPEEVKKEGLNPPET